jgi:hypothetical protein
MTTRIKTLELDDVNSGYINGEYEVELLVYDITAEESNTLINSNIQVYIVVKNTSISSITVLKGNDAILGTYYAIPKNTIGNDKYIRCFVKSNESTILINGSIIISEDQIPMLYNNVSKKMEKRTLEQQLDYCFNVIKPKFDKVYPGTFVVLPSTCSFMMSKPELS